MLASIRIAVQEDEDPGAAARGSRSRAGGRPSRTCRPRRGPVGGSGPAPPDGPTGTPLSPRCRLAAPPVVMRVHGTRRVAGLPAPAARPAPGPGDRSPGQRPPRPESGPCARPGPSPRDPRSSSARGTGACPPGGADLAGADHEDLLLDRAGPEQQLPVGRAGGRGEGGRAPPRSWRPPGRGSGRARGSGGRSRATDRAPVAAGEAPRSPRPAPGAMVADSQERRAGQRHVEEVDLAVDGHHVAVRPDQAAGVGQAVRRRRCAARGSCRPPGGSPAPGDLGRPRTRSARPGARHRPGGPRAAPATEKYSGRTTSSRPGPRPRSRPGCPADCQVVLRGRVPPSSGWRRRGWHRVGQVGRRSGTMSIRAGRSSGPGPGNRRPPRNERRVLRRLRCGPQRRPGGGLP